MFRTVCALGLTALLAAAAAPAQALDKSIVDQSVKLCVNTHADPAKVIAAAEADGWTPPDAAKQQELAARFTTFTPTIRLKTVDGKAMMLVSGETIEDKGDGEQVQRRCWVTASAPNTPDILAAMTTYFGRPSNSGSGTASGWLFSIKAGGRVFLDGSRDPGFTYSLKDGPMGLMMTNSGGPDQNVGYNETSWRPKP